MKEGGGVVMSGPPALRRMNSYGKGAGFGLSPSPAAGNIALQAAKAAVAPVPAEGITKQMVRRRLEEVSAEGRRGDRWVMLQPSLRRGGGRGFQSKGYFGWGGLLNVVHESF